MGLLVEEGQRAVGEDVGKRVDGDGHPVWRGELVSEVSASRRLPAQGSAESQGAGVVEDPEGGLEQLHLLGVELLASLPPFGVMIGGDGEGTRDEVGFAAGEELPEPPLYGEYGRLVPGGVPMSLVKRGGRFLRGRGQRSEHAGVADMIRLMPATGPRARGQAATAAVLSEAVGGL